MMLVPLLGRAYLDDVEYSCWALIATIGTVGLLVDMGAPSLAVRLATQNAATNRRVILMCAISAAPTVIIGVVAVLMWPQYMMISHLTAIPHMQLLLALAAIGGASRSALVIYASLALGAEDFKFRSFLLTVQALVNCGLVWLLLATGSGVVAYPLAAIVSSVILLPPACMYWLRNRTRRHAWADSGESLSFRSEILRFVYARGIGAILGLSLTQLDRWAIGLVGNSAFLSDYDLAARFAVIPKTALLTLGLGFVHEAARIRDGNLMPLYRRLNIVTCVMLLIGALGATLFALLYFALVGVDPEKQYWILYLILIVAYSAHATTAPGVLILTGLGMPRYELYYLVPAFVCSLLSTVYFVIHRSDWGVAISISGSLAFASIVFALWVKLPISRISRLRSDNHTVAVAR